MPRRTKRWLLLLVALGLIARLVRYAVGFPIWGDEAFVACNFLTRDLRGLLTKPLEFEMVVPLGWLLPTHALASWLGPAPWVLRLPALLCGVGALLGFVAFSRRVLSGRARLAAVALFAASYYLIRHGAEVKPYALDLLCGLAITASAWPLVTRRGTSATVPLVGSCRGWIVFALVSAVAVWCSYPAFFVASGALLVASGAAWRDRKRRPAGEVLARAAVAGLVLLASFAAMYFLVGRHQQWSEERLADARHWDDHFPAATQPWLWPWWLLRELAGNMLAYPNGGPRFGSSATLLLAIAGGVSLWRRGRAREVLLLISPLLPMFAAALLRKYPFGGSARITLHLATPICLLVGQGVIATAAAIARRFRARRPIRIAARTAIGFAAAMALLAAGTSAADLAHPFKGKGDVKNRAALEWLRDASAPGDRWLVFGNYGDEDGAALPDGSGAPDLRGWRGSSGRLRYYLLLFARERGVTVEWAGNAATAPAALPEIDGHRFLVAYHDNESPFPAVPFGSWRTVLFARFGPPRTQQRCVLGPAGTGQDGGDEALEFLAITGRAAAR